MDKKPDALEQIHEGIFGDDKKPDALEQMHEGLQEISYLMGIIDMNCADVKAIVNRLSKKYELSKREIRELAVAKKEHAVAKKYVSEKVLTRGLGPNGRRRSWAAEARHQLDTTPRR